MYYVCIIMIKPSGEPTAFSPPLAIVCVATKLYYMYFLTCLTPTCDWTKNDFVLPSVPVSANVYRNYGGSESESVYVPETQHGK